MITDPRGVQLQHTWSTTANQVFLNAVDPVAPDVSLTYAWDGRGNLLSTARTDEGSTAVTNTFQYDSLGDRTKETDSQLPSAWTRTAVFDGRGLPTRTALNTTTLTRTFDPLGRLTALKVGSESNLASYTYSGFGYRLTRSLQNGVLTSYTYDLLGRLTGQVDAKGSTTLATWTWGVPLDAVPRRAELRIGTAIDDKLVATTDAALRLTNEDTSAGTAGFAVTPTTSWSAANTAATAALTTTKWRYTLDGRSAWTQRVRGTSGTTDYLRDARDALTRVGTQNVTLDALGAITNDGSLQATYDPLGQVRTVTSGTKVRTYKRDALGRVVTETDEAGKVTSYAWDGATRIVRMRSGGTTFDVNVDGDGLDEHIATITGSSRQYLHQDRRGSVYLVTNSAGGAAEVVSYTAYGEATLRNPATGATLANSAVSAQFGFNGLPHDFAIGLVDMRARMYRPVLGRFLSPDPLGLVDGTNRFGFVGADPLSFRDPFGLDKVAAYKALAGIYFPSIPSSWDFHVLHGVGNGAAMRILRDASNLNDSCNPTLGRGCWMDGVINAGHAIQTRVKGLGKIVLGGTVFAVGYGLCQSGIGCAIGGAIMLQGSDIAGSGVVETFTNSSQPTAVGAILGNDAQQLQEALASGIAAAGPFAAPFLGAVTKGSGVAVAAMDAAGGAGESLSQGLTAYHGTDIASARKLLGGQDLQVAKATAGKIDGPIGFYVATDSNAAAYFALRRQPGGILRYDFSEKAVSELGASGAVLGPIPAGGMAGGFPGQQFFIPPDAFGLFNDLRAAGEITVSPY